MPYEPRLSQHGTSGREPPALPPSPPERPQKERGAGPAHTRPEPTFRGSGFFRFHPPSLQGGPARTQLPVRPGGSRSRFRRVSRVPRSVPASKCSLRSPWGARRDRTRVTMWRLLARARAPVLRAPLLGQKPPDPSRPCLSPHPSPASGISHSPKTLRTVAEARRRGCLLLPPLPP